MPRGQSETGNRRTFNIIFTMSLWPKKERRRVKPLRTNDRLSYTNSTKDRGELGCSTDMDENDLMCNKILICMLQFHNASIYSLTWMQNAHHLYCGRCPLYIVDVVHSTFEELNGDFTFRYTCIAIDKFLCRIQSDFPNSFLDGLSTIHHWVSY